MQVDPKNDRIGVSVAKSSLGMSQERDRWLLLYPDFGISKGHAQLSASKWKFPLAQALLLASVLTSSGFFPVLVLFSICRRIALAWRRFGGPGGFAAAILLVFKQSNNS